jgi:hypothetical protein
MMSELCLETLGEATGEDAGDAMGEPAQSVSTELLEGKGYFSEGHCCCCCCRREDVLCHLPGKRRGRKEFQPKAQVRIAAPMTMTRTITTTIVVIRELIVKSSKRAGDKECVYLKSDVVGEYI